MVSCSTRVGPSRTCPPTSDASTDAINNRLLVIQLAYLSQDMRGLEQAQMRLQPVNVAPPQEGDTYSMLYYDYPARTFRTGEFEVTKRGNGSTARRTDVTSRALAWQSYLLDRHLDRGRKVALGGGGLARLAHRLVGEPAQLLRRHLRVIAPAHQGKPLAQRLRQLFRRLDLDAVLQLRVGELRHQQAEDRRRRAHRRFDSELRGEL